MFLGQETTQLIYFQTQQVNRYTTDNRHFIDIGYFDNRACYTFRCEASNLTSKKLKVSLR